MNEIRAVRGVAKQFLWLLPVIGVSHAGVARADACEDSLVAQVFAHHAADPSPDSKVALHAWLCEGASDAFLSQQAALPASTTDLATWTALLGAIDADTEISSTPVGSADVALFRANNCAPSQNYLIHALGRVATAAEFEAWHACDAAATDAANGSSAFFDLDLSCAGQQTASGTLQLSVRGFHSSHANAITPLRNFVIGDSNLTRISGSTEILSGESGLFEFTVDDPTLESSVTLRGSVATSFGDEVSYYCDVVIAKPTASRPYELPPEAECAFEPSVSTSTPCAGGYVEERCVDNRWQDACVPFSQASVLASKDVAETGSSFIPNNGDVDGGATIVMKSAQMETTLDRVEFAGFVPRPHLNVSSAKLVVFVETDNAPITLYGPNGETLVTSPAGPAGPRVFDVTSVVQGWNAQGSAPRLFKLRATPTTRIGTGKNTTIRALEFAGTDSDPRLEVQY